MWHLESYHDSTQSCLAQCEHQLDPLHFGVEHWGGVLSAGDGLLSSAGFTLFADSVTSFSRHGLSGYLGPDPAAEDIQIVTIPDAPQIMETDASDYAIAAIHSIRTPDGELHPIAFHSWTH